MKTIKQLVIFIGIFFMCLGFTACSAKEEASNDLTAKDEQQLQAPESQTPQSKTSESQAPGEEATMDNSDGTVDRIDVHIKVDEIFTATMDENPSTGFSWQYKIGDEEIASIDSDKVLEDGSKNNDQPATVGAGNQHEWHFKGLKHGSTTITFDYLRSWENADTAAKTIIYNITVE